MEVLILRLKGFYKYKNLFKQLVMRDIRLKYRRSVLGYLWSVLNPLFVMIIMVVVFSNIFRSDVENFPLYLISGQILFNYMNEATNGAIQSVIGASGLLKKIYVPKYIFTVSKVTSTLITMVLSLFAMLLVAVATRAPVTWSYLFLVVPIAELYIFCIGLGLFLAQAAVFFRDIQYIYSVILTGWMYMTPIFYPTTMLSDQLAYIITRFNPMYYYMEQFRRIVMYGVLPNWKLSAYGLAVGLVVLVFGTWSFCRAQDKFILYV